MRRILAMLLILTAPAVAQDIAGASDHPVVGRFEGSTIIGYEALDYDAQKLLTAYEPETYETLEGKVTRIEYDNPGASMLQVVRSFQQRLEADGFETVIDCPKADCFKLGIMRLREVVGSSRLGAEYHALTLRRENDEGRSDVQITAIPNRIWITVVETAVMENKAIDAVAIETTLMSEGRMAFYDIHFNTGSANLSSDSDATLALIAEVLSDNPEMSVVIVGHTDNVGDLEMNLALSRNRAQAVVDRLTNHNGIDGGRLTGAGVGFLAPVATNATDAGRALNRRVEVVVR